MAVDGAPGGVLWDHDTSRSRDVELIETAKAVTIAYNDKNWDKMKSAFAEKASNDEKARDAASRRRTGPRSVAGLG